MDKEQALEEFNKNKYFIETLTTKYLSYPNYQDILQQAYLTAWESLLRYNEESGVKITTWIQANVEPALKGYAIKENYNGIIKHNNKDAMKVIGIIGKGKKEGKTEQEIWKRVKDEGINIDADSWRWIWENGGSSGAKTQNTTYANEEEKDKDLWDTTHNIEDIVCKKDNVKYILNVVDKVTDRCSDRQKNIYMSWINKQISDSKGTMKSIAEDNGCTPQNVNFVIKKINKKVQNYFDKHGLNT